MFNSGVRNSHGLVCGEDVIFNIMMQIFIENVLGE